MYYISYVLLYFAIVELNSNVFKFNNKKIVITANAIQICVDKAWNTPPHLDFLRSWLFIFIALLDVRSAAKMHISAACSIMVIAAIASKHIY